MIEVLKRSNRMLLLMLILVLMVTVAYDQCIFFCFIEVYCS